MFSQGKAQAANSSGSFGIFFWMCPLGEHLHLKLLEEGNLMIRKTHCPHDDCKVIFSFLQLEETQFLACNRYWEQLTRRHSLMTNSNIHINWNLSS